MNVSMPIAAVLLDLGFPASTVKAIPILARTAGLLAHLAEEQRAADRLPDGRRARRRRSTTSREQGLMLAPDVEARPWDEQLAARRRGLPRAARLPVRALGLLPREARRRPASAAAEAAGGLADIARLPLTEKHELQATATAENPVGAHLCADAGRDRAHLLDQRHDRHAELHPAHRGRPRELGDGLGPQLRRLRRRAPASGSSRTYNAGPFVAGAALAAFDRIGLCHIPVGTGNTERLMLAIELLRPEAAVLTPSYAAYLVEWAAERGIDLRGVERRARAGRGRAGRRRAGLPRAGSRRAGARR